MQKISHQINTNKRIIIMHKIIIVEYSTELILSKSLEATFETKPRTRLFETMPSLDWLNIQVETALN